MEQEKKFLSKFNLLKPGITLLLDLVAVTSFLLGLRNSIYLWKIIPLLFSGTLASFSSSLLNNYFDRDIDSKMRRTQWRADFNWNHTYLTIIIAMLSVSLTISYLYLNEITTIWIFLGFVSYSILYTKILKRNTMWNIVIGGVAGSFPALAGWSAINSPISFQSLYLAILIFLWTPTHFWSLALKYKDDYKAAEIPMMPSLMDTKKASGIILLNTIILALYSIIPVFLPYFPILFRILLFPLSVYLLYQSLKLSLARREKIEKVAIKTFLASNYFLTGALLIAILGMVIH